MRNKGLIIVFMLLCVLPIEARTWQTVTVNEDSTVSFCYCGAARKVYVQTDLYDADKDSTRYTDLHTRRMKMERQSDGCFHVTTNAIQPETYTYCFRVNGRRKPDPYNNDTAWQKMHKWNVVTVGGSAQSDRYQQPAQQGTLHRMCWYSTAEGLCRRVNIYLPAGYFEEITNDQLPITNDQLPITNNQYPVLYLIHGINGYEGSWTERGRAIQIMENLVAEGKCQPMILVMPDVNFGVHEDRPSHHTLWNNVFNYPRLCHDHDIEKALLELIQMVDTAFRVSDTRYIAGFSDGARLAANAANLLPGYFAAVGLFSPVVHKDQLPTTNDQGQTTNDQGLTTDYYVYTGKRDMFHANAKRFHRRLTKAQVPHTYTETIGGHTWRNWRLYLSDYMVKINP